MKKIGDLMMELGFNKEAPDSLKEAFIRHLVKKAEGIDLQARNKVALNPTEQETKKIIELPEQLEFDFYKKGAS